MNTASLFRYAGWSAFLSVAATLIGFFFLVLFFSIGGPFGSLNDAASVMQILFTIPVALALYYLLRTAAPRASLAAAAVGIGSMLVIVVLQSVIVVNPAMYPQVGGLVLTAGGGLGLWLVLANFLARRGSSVPRRLTWLGIASGVGYIVLVIGFWLGGQENSLFAAGSLAVLIAYPIWAIWLGRVLTSGRLAAGT